MNARQQIIEMHDEAERDKITVLYHPLKGTPSVCVNVEDSYGIGITPWLTEREEAECLALEMARAHESLPDADAPAPVKQRADRRASRRAADRLVSWEDFQAALSNPWSVDDASIAAYLGVSVYTLHCAVEHFRHKGLLDW